MDTIFSTRLYLIILSRLYIVTQNIGSIPSYLSSVAIM